MMCRTERALTPRALIDNEQWIPYDTVCFSDGRLILLDVYRVNAQLRFSPILESTLSSYFQYNPEGISDLTEMWRVHQGEALLVGGGGSFEDDGYVALFIADELAWIFFSTHTGPLKDARVVRDEISVRTEDGSRLRLGYQTPYIINRSE